MSELINKRSGRRRNYDYEQKEKEYQEAQTRWEQNENDKQAWDTMFMLINLAVFNNLNKDLEHKLEKETIEERAMDITCDIMRTLKNKRAKGKEWKIGRVSSAVHLPCLAKYRDEYKEWDRMLHQDSFTKYNEFGQEVMEEYEDSKMVNGVYQIHEGNGIYLINEEYND